MARILFLSRGGRLGGSQRQLHHVVANLDRSRYEPVVVCREGGPFVDLLARAGVEIHVVRLRPWRKFPEGLLRYADGRRLVELARSRRAVLVHSSDLWLSGYLLRVARGLGIPSVLHVRAPKPPRELRKHRCSRPTAVIAISGRVRGNLIQAGVPDEKIALIYDAVDLRDFHPDRAAADVLRRDFPQARGAMVGIVGRIKDSKRQLSFLRAAQRLVESCRTDVTFFVIGNAHETDYSRRIRHFADQSGLGERVIFTGRRNDLPEVLASLDVLVTLSGGSVMIEAMACGTPVVSAGFTQPGESTIVRDGQTGLLIPPGREGDLDAALARLIEDAALRRRMGRAARQHAEAHYSHVELVAKTQGLYDRLLGARGASTGPTVAAERPPTGAQPRPTGTDAGRESTSTEGAARIGDVELRCRTILAPACGVLNLPMRLVFRRFGAGLTYVPVLDAEAVAESERPRLINILGREETTCDQERPVAIQLIGSDPRTVAEAAGRIEPLASIIDLNFSGPLEEVLRRGMGAALLSSPGRIGEIVRAVVERVSVPVTAKIRIGIRGRDVDVAEVARTCEQAGASAITVHARSADQGYSRGAHWEFIQAVKDVTTIPVIGNGGVHGPEDAAAMVRQTGCDFVMICSAAFVNPLIFRQCNALLAGNGKVDRGELSGLIAFMNEYYSLARQLESRSRRSAFKKSFRQFLALRSYMKKLIAGKVEFP